uniref:Uncharacterized protein LOC104212438 n=1 Tax=Nicotiana sylvestris TaxID=4096 RepID=A0A1U7V0T4_NICSY|nr:PREDICTED: uncharacterized protein LOC104212438 [Nicotiana sylvestris]
MVSAHFAGRIATHSVLLKLALILQVSISDWIIDSGESNHMTSLKSLLFNIQPLIIPCLVSHSNGYKVKVTNSGSLTLFPNFTLHNVLYVPSFHYNLISVHKSVDRFNGIAQFTKVLCVLRGLSLKKPLALDKLDNGLYKLQAPMFRHDNCVSNSIFSSTCTVSGSSVVSSCNFALVVSNKIDIVWHFRLGHIPFSRMKGIPILSPCLSSKQSFPCPVCPLARKTRLSFPDNTIHSTAPFQLIHIDTWSLYHSSTSHLAKYFLTIVDDYPRATWTHLMGAKNNAFDLLKAFIVMVETHFNTHVQTVRSDNVFELGSSTIVTT